MKGHMCQGLRALDSGFREGVEAWGAKGRGHLAMLGLQCPDPSLRAAGTWFASSAVYLSLMRNQQTLKA